jgi:hypothetical protein
MEAAGHSSVRRWTGVGRQEVEPRGSELDI